MNFVYPQFLFALFALAIPVIVHLFNFRRFKRVMFTNVRFLQELKQDTRHRSKLKHLLVLASRLLALLFLILAFAQPYLPSGKGKARAAKNVVSIWIDNSFSMNATGKYGPLLDVAKERAREIALSYSGSDRFQLLTNDFEARQQRLITRDELLQWLDEVRPTSTVRTLDEVIRRQQDALSTAPKINGENFASFLLSDFQSSLITATPLPLDSAVHYYVLPFKANATINLYIDTCFLANPYIQPGSAQELTVRVKNAGDELVENVPVKLTVNGGQRALSSVSVEAGSVSEIKLPFSITASGFQQAAVSLADYPVTFDDTFFFSFNVRPNVQVTSINGKEAAGNYLDALYGNDPYFSYHRTDEGHLDYNAFGSQQLIILNGIADFASGIQQELKRYMENGGRLMIIPSSSMNAEGYSRFASSCSLPNLTGPVNVNEKIGKLDNGHPLLSGIFEKGKSQPENMDLPFVRQAFLQTPAGTATMQTILKMENNSPFLSFTPVGKGGCYILAVPLNPEFSNFPQHALFVPVFLKAVLLGSSEIGPGKTTGTYAEFSAGDSVLSGDQVYHVVNGSIGFDAIPSMQRLGSGTLLSLDDQVKIAGNYEIRAGAVTVNTVAFNYDRKESNLETLDQDKIEEMIGGTMNAPEMLDPDNASVGHSLARLREGISLWKYCIMLALLFLAAEVLLIRFFKR